jgi:cytochrome c-type biogenesis protein
VPFAADTVNATIFVAFAAGFLSFVSPCVLPLVPGYLSAVSGISLTEVQTGERKRVDVLWPAIQFCLGFTIVFVALGMFATGLGAPLADNRDLLNTIAGLLLIVMGSLFLLIPRIPALNRELRPDGLLHKAVSVGPVLAGGAFAFGWTPCTGPILGAILNAAATKDSVAAGVILIVVGVLVATDQMTRLNTEARAALDSLGLQGLVDAIEM